MQTGKDDKVAMAELFGLFKQHYQVLSTAFMYYSCGGSSDTFHMSLNQFTSFLEDCKVGCCALWPDAAVVPAAQAPAPCHGQGACP